MGKQFLTTVEVAAMIGVTVARVQAMIKQGKLPAEKIGRDWMIRPADVKLVENRKPGRPRTKE